MALSDISFPRSAGYIGRRSACEERKRDDETWSHRFVASFLRLLAATEIQKENKWAAYEHVLEGVQNTFLHKNNAKVIKTIAGPHFTRLKTTVLKKVGFIQTGLRHLQHVDAELVELCPLDI